MSSTTGIRTSPLGAAALLGVTNLGLFELTLGTGFRKIAWAISQYGPYPLLLCIAGAYLACVVLTSFSRARAREILPSFLVFILLAAGPTIVHLFTVCTWNDVGMSMARGGCGPMSLSHVVGSILIIGGVFVIPILCVSVLEAWMLRRFGFFQCSPQTVTRL